MVGPLTTAVPPDQAGHQPVPGPRDGPAGQCAEWERLSHSEDQVTQIQETPHRVLTCLSGSGAIFTSSSLLKWPAVLSKRGIFGACDSGCRLLVSTHSRKFQRPRYLTCKKRERTWRGSDATVDTEPFFPILYVRMYCQADPLYMPLRVCSRMVF